MKNFNLLLIALLLLCLAQPVAAQSEADTVPTPENTAQSNFRTIIRFKPAATLLTAVLYRAVDLELVMVPYVHPNIGIPVEVQFAYMQGIYGVAFLTGIEATPITHREKSGLYMNLEGGIITAGGLFGFCATSNIGYQLVSKRGFVFTPAAGVKYDSVSAKIALNLMLDIGIAF
jgi:hypothetical protein